MIDKNCFTYLEEIEPHNNILIVKLSIKINQNYKNHYFKSLC